MDQGRASGTLCMTSRCPERSKEGIRSPGVGVTRDVAAGEMVLWVRAPSDFPEDPVKFPGSIPGVSQLPVISASGHPTPLLDSSGTCTYPYHTNTHTYTIKNKN